MAGIAMATSLSPREHIEKIRRDTFFIGREERNPLAAFLHQAVGYLSEELYTKDSHFIFELIQNAQDNEYDEGVVPSLELVVTDKDVTGTGAPATLLVFNNERGFTPANVEGICGVGSSMKKGNRQRGYIGEKGIGFKSVFLVSSQPHIFSRGYQIKFNEKPTPECNIGYIVPEWVENKPSQQDIHQIYGSSKPLPTTTIIIPLKSEKVKTVKDQLSCIHPEMVLFLSKIRGLSVREDNSDPRLNTVRAFSIASETNFCQRKNVDAESYTLHLECQEEMCAYYMWRQRFAVRPENRVEKRKEVEEWNITLAFPQGQRLHQGEKMPGIYAFLPTGMVTNLPFIIQADFILVSSRESILLDNVWNIGILNCVAATFKNAFLELVKSNAKIPLSLLPPLFKLLPVNSSHFSVLETVRLSIKNLLASEHIIPCESYTEQRIFCKASEVGRLKPAFWNILTDARKDGVDLQSLSSHGIHILCSAFDQSEYDSILEFLGVRYVSKEWYGKCIESSNLAAETSENVYCDLLSFIATNWEGYFIGSCIESTPILKYVNAHGVTSLWSVERATKHNDRICTSGNLNELSWLLKWNREFQSAANLFFVPEATQAALSRHSLRSTITKWLSQNVYVKNMTPYDYSCQLLNAVKSNRKKLVDFTHFVFHSHTTKFLNDWDVKLLTDALPLVDNYGNVSKMHAGVLVPAKCSKWVNLVGSNPWGCEKYIVLSQDYTQQCCLAGVVTPENALLKFLRSHVGASDVPEICPPNATFPTVFSLLMKDNAFLLLEWIRNLKCRNTSIPNEFLQCVKAGAWLKTSVGARAPQESFLSNSEWGNLLQVGPLLVDIPLIEHEFYDHRIYEYKYELKMLGVMSEFGEACRFIGKRLTSVPITRSNVVAMLKFIGFLQQKYMSTSDFVNTIREEKWLRTCRSNMFMSPVGAILYDSCWASAAVISDLPFIDTEYYGESFHSYKTELELLGVTIHFGYLPHCQLVIDNLRSSFSVTSDVVIFMLDCIRNANSATKLIERCKDSKWVKTKLGFRCPAESILFDPEWECVFKVVDSLPIVDEEYYGAKISSYREELQKIGVMVGLEGALKAVARELKQLTTSCSLRKENVLALLACFRVLFNEKQPLPVEFASFVYRGEWLQTVLGCRAPENSILFNAEWLPISAMASLPFVDNRKTFYGKAINEYGPELKALGVVAELEKGLKFVVKGINIPSNPSEITPPSALALLECIRIMRKKKWEISKEFRKGIDMKWLKTSMGYKSPKECALFGDTWLDLLEQTDAPFIDEAFYSPEIVAYRDELEEIGVTIDASDGCALVAENLKLHADFAAIVRIYSYLKGNKWQAPKNDVNSLIWIPDGSNSGEWVTSDSCALYDKNDLFGSKLHILDKYYEKNLLSFFSLSLGVRNDPKPTHYCELWNEWENTKQQITESECRAFWVYFSKKWNNKTAQFIHSTLKKLPVICSSGIALATREDVFIPDDLLLKDLFDRASEESIFVWHPQPSLPFLSMTEMFGIYSDLGVRCISKAVEKKEISMPELVGTRRIYAEDKLFKAGLFRIILGFLVDPSLDMCIDKRHVMVKSLLDATISETAQPICADYNLKSSSGKNVTVTASRNISWDRNSSKFFVYDGDVKSCMKASIEFATYFAEVVAEGLLWEDAERIPKLAELIRLGCLIDFHDDAVGFLLKSQNLQLFMEDEMFLSSALLPASN